MSVDHKVICLECRLRWPFVCQNDLWRRLKPEFAKTFFWAKVSESSKIYGNLCIEIFVKLLRKF